VSVAHGRREISPNGNRRRAGCKRKATMEAGSPFEANSPGLAPHRSSRGLEGARRPTRGPEYNGGMRERGQEQRTCGKDGENLQGRADRRGTSPTRRRAPEISGRPGGGPQPRRTPTSDLAARPTRPPGRGQVSRPILGLCLERLGRQADAARVYDEALARDPNDPELLTSRALMRIETDPAGALRDSAKAAQLSAPSAWPYFILARYALLRGMYGEALRQATQASRHQAGPLFRLKSMN
jgi:tetratricopeptide (TPR) repeat protein